MLNKGLLTALASVAGSVTFQSFMPAQAYEQHSEPISEAAKNNESELMVQKQQYQQYAIRWGDTLYSLSQEFDISVGMLAALNEIDNPDVIFSGESLIISAPMLDVAKLDAATLPVESVLSTSVESAERDFIWPTYGTLTSGYGWRWGRMHRGVDIAAPVGTPVMATAEGIVTYAGWNAGGYGNLVEIRHPDGSLSRYAHNSRLWVELNQVVVQGQLISEMGSTGRSTGPHLHFELHHPEQGSVDPLSYLQQAAL